MGIIGRVVARCLLQHAFYHFAYVDDVHPTFYGKRMYINFLVWLILQEMIGVLSLTISSKGKPWWLSLATSWTTALG